MHSQCWRPDVHREQGSGSGRSPVGPVFRYSLLPTRGWPCQPAINGLSPYSRYPFQSIAISSLWILLQPSPSSVISALHCILIYPLLFVSSAMCCLYVAWASWLKDFIEDHLISWTWHPAHAVVFQWKQLETLPCLGYAHYSQYLFLDLSRHCYRHPLWMSLRFTNLSASCSHPCPQKHSLAVRGVQKYSIHFSHEARTNQK